MECIMITCVHIAFNPESSWSSNGIRMGEMMKWNKKCNVNGNQNWKLKEATETAAKNENKNENQLKANECLREMNWNRTIKKNHWKWTKSRERERGREGEMCERWFCSIRWIRFNSWFIFYFNFCSRFRHTAYVNGVETIEINFHFGIILWIFW